MKLISSILILLIGFNVLGQNISKDRPHCSNSEFDKKVTNTIGFTIPLLSVVELNKSKESYIILDAREILEYNASHIPKAIHIGYDAFDLKSMKNISKDKKIVVYCTIGYRSEKIGEKLKKDGFKNVWNLYGSILEWSNQDFELVDKNQKPTKRVHTYNKSWGKWLLNPKYQKVY
jgi:rhodanese-related sulfurtransferase